MIERLNNKVLATVNSTALNIGVNVFLNYGFLRVYAQCAYDGSYGSSTFNFFFKEHPYCSPELLLMYQFTFPRIMQKGSFSLYSP